MITLERMFYDDDDDEGEDPALLWLKKLGYYSCDYCLIGKSDMFHRVYKIRFFNPEDATAFLLLFP